MIVNIQASKGTVDILNQAGLPYSDIADIKWLDFIGWRQDSKIVGIAGMEQCGSQALLRSVAIVPQYRSQGIGKKLVAELHDRAQRRSVTECYLLTLDAENYFDKIFDYQIIERLDAPHDIANSSQFTGVCPASATLMKKLLN